MIKKHLVVTYVFLFITSLLLCKSFAADLTLKAPTQVYFSPNGAATEAIIREINNAKSEILIQGYPFTPSPLAKALVDTHKRGVKVEAILDKSQRKGKHTSATVLASMKIPTYIDGKHSIAHNNVMIIDNVTVITGPFSFTRAAEEKNAENLLIIKSKDLAKLYADNWSEHRGHSEEYHRKQVAHREAAPKKKP